MNNGKSLARIFTLAVGAIGLAATLAASPALAHDTRRPERIDRHTSRHERDHGRRGHHRRHANRQHRAYRDFAVPSRIDNRHTYRHHARGRAYHRAHRHHHDVYYFPVAVEYGTAWRPHYYCQGQLYGGHLAVHGRRFSVGVRF